MNKRLATGLLFAVAISGCATQWGHPTASQYDFQRDQAQCNIFAQQSSPTVQAPYNPYLTQMQQAQQTINQSGANLGAAVGQMSSFNNCMQAKGYYKMN